MEKLVRETAGMAQKVEKGAEQLVKKAWSAMDAAAEKQTPSQYLSDAGIKAIQGRGQEG